MLAKCAKCQHVFSTDHYGQNVCPVCGTELMLSPPGGSGQQPYPPAAGSGASQAGAGDPGSWQGAPGQFGPEGAPFGQAGELPGSAAGPWQSAEAPLGPTPWEERATRGFFAAYAETLKRSFVAPVEFFGSMRVDNMNGAISFYWLNTAIGAIVGYFWQALFAVAGSGTNVSLPAEHPFAQYADFQPGPLFYLGMGVAAAAFAPVALFISAGIYHLGAMLFKTANNGFNATVRSVAYASGPALLAIVPFCGSAAGGLWTLALVVIGLWKTQRGSLGGAVGAVLVPIVVVACCVCASVGAAAAVGGFAAASALGAAGN
ncbi:MAG: YIP1 family protein [Myxococcales bacterium]|jgi:hypothetical protein